MSVARRFRADVEAHFDPALVDALVIQEEFGDAVPPDAPKDAAAA